MEIYKFKFDSLYNNNLINHFDSILFDQSNYACDPGTKKYHPEYGEYNNNERDFFIHELFPNNDDNIKLNNLKLLYSYIPLFFDTLREFCIKKDKFCRFNRVCLIGYNKSSQYVSEHMHNPPHNDYVGMYYPHDASHGTEVWHDNTWQTLDNDAGTMHIIPATMLHRFYMKKNDDKRIMIIANISLVNSDFFNLF